MRIAFWCRFFRFPLEGRMSSLFEMEKPLKCSLTSAVCCSVLHEVALSPRILPETYYLPLSDPLTSTPADKIEHLYSWPLARLSCSSLQPLSQFSLNYYPSFLEENFHLAGVHEPVLLLKISDPVSYPYIIIVHRPSFKPPAESYASLTLRLCC